jgi:hypothetical protein
MTNYCYSVVKALCTAAAIFATTMTCPAAELLVGDLATNSISAYDATTGDFRRVVVAPNANLFAPAGMAIGFGGDLFVVSQGTGQVLRYNAVTGAPKGNSPGSPVFLNLGVDASGLMYDEANDRLFVGLFNSASSNVIKVFNSSGNEIQEITGGPAAGRTGMVLDSVGNLYVNSFNEDGFAPGAGETGAVLKFDGPNFATWDAIIEGDEDYQTQPIVGGMNGLAIDENDTLYAVSLFGQQVIKLTTAGMPIGGLGSQNPPTAYPSAILIDGSTVLVSTLGNNNPEDPIYGMLPPFPGSVQKFDLNGNFLGELVTVDPESAFLPTAMVLVPDPISGDFDGDYDVDGDDFAIWQDSFPISSGASLADGDADGDGDVDGADFVVWQTNYPVGGETVAVPEPMGWMLLATGGLAWVVARKIRRANAI